ncbi:MAG: hypothetical protein GY799_13335, partial [Desulfobulbaceae bacterium]|nr:hypothetical protein [Desulfobulbaceae bacterium]
YCNSVKKQGGSGYFIRNLGYFAPNHDRLYIRFTKDLSYADFQRLSDREFLTGEQASFIKEIIESFDSDIKITDFIQEEIPGTTPHVTAKLKLLKQSYEANLITKKEYEAKKNALLDAL